MLSIKPITATENSVYSLEGKIKELLNLIEAENGVSSIGLFGSWGCGKTSILKICESNIRSDGRHIIIWVDSWRYTTSSISLWKVITQNVIANLREKLTSDELSTETPNSQTFNELLNEIEKTLYRSQVFTDENLSLNVSGLATKSIDLTLSLLANSLPGGAFINQGIDYLKANFSEGQTLDEVQSIFKKNENERFRAELKSAEQFCYLISILDDVLGQLNRKICIFLDDLDRCNPEEIIAFSVSIRTLLSRSNIIVITACDPDILDLSIKHHWKKFIKDEEFNDNAGVIEKLFDYSIRIKPPSRADIFQISKLTFAEYLNDKQVAIIADCLPLNFRKAIKFLIKANNALSANDTDLGLARLKMLAVDEYDPELSKSIHNDDTFLNEFATKLSSFRSQAKTQNFPEADALDKLLMSNEFPPITNEGL